jgi:anti-sigma B factor antagonist
LETTVISRGDVTVVVLGGTIDAVNAFSVSETFKNQVQEGRKNLIADLGRVIYMSSAGIASILTSLKEARDHGGDLRVANAQKSVKKTMDLAGITEITEFFTSVEAGVKSFEQK